MHYEFPSPFFYYLNVKETFSERSLWDDNDDNDDKSIHDDDHHHHLYKNSSLVAGFHSS